MLQFLLLSLELLPILLEFQQLLGEVVDLALHSLFLLVLLLKFLLQLHLLSFVLGDLSLNLHRLSLEVFERLLLQFEVLLCLCMQLSVLL